jgi:hypothetical protein
MFCLEIKPDLPRMFRPIMFLPSADSNALLENVMEYMLLCAAKVKSPRNQINKYAHYAETPCTLLKPQN